LTGRGRVALTAGASAPELLVEQVTAKLKEWGAIAVIEQTGIPENVVFPLPKELQTPANKRGVA
jgi:4-hydroxy-3-methylbut-2-enyl diphosphate reductase